MIIKNKKKYTFLQIGVLVVALLIPFFLAAYPLFMGRISFWYDPSRDFLLALGNIHKITLIGPTSGIPGVFYGPYWIWLLSFGMLFSLDPRIVIFLVLTVPYFTLFPYILYRFRIIFGITTSLLLWLTFILVDGIHYAINPWNPNLAPLLFLILVYLLTFTNLKEDSLRKNIKVFIMGIISGLVINFHISFGLGMIVGVLLFLILYTWKAKVHWKSILKILLFFITGVVLTFIPFFLFESRHGFHQIQTVLTTLASKNSVVAVKGLSTEAILQGFFGSVQSFVPIPVIYAYLFIAVAVAYFVYQLKSKKVILKEHEKKLLLVLFSVSVGILSLYLSSKNPVWSYHFIGVEIISLLFLGVIIRNNKVLKIVLGIFLTILLYVGVAHTVNSFHQVHFDDQSLVTREYVTRLIYQDAGDTQYTVFAYSPSIYTYDYSYLFQWIAHKDVPYDPNMIPQGASLVYLIMPPGITSTEDFINSRTSNKQYKTVAHWVSPDNTIIVKRMKVK